MAKKAALNIAIGIGQGEHLRLGELNEDLRALLLPFVSVQELGELLDLMPRRIQQLTDEHVLIRAGRGLYPAGLNVSRYMSYLRDTRQGGS